MPEELKSRYDYDTDQPLIRRANYTRMRRDAMRDLQTLAFAVAFDGRLDDPEIQMLRSWLHANAEFRSEWPVGRIADLMDEVLSDGVITHDERISLFLVLREFASKDPHRQKATEAIFDDDAEFVIPSKAVVITGGLEFSKRKPFQERLAALGAIIHDNVRRDTDFVVVGLEGNDQWSTDRYGSKIDKAMQMKRSAPPHPIKIIREEFAVEALLRLEAVRRPFA